MKVVFFPNPGGFQSWLEESHQRCEELWVGFYKKSSDKPSITYPEAVDEALCFGWIDGVGKKVNDDAYTVRFTPPDAQEPVERGEHQETGEAIRCRQDAPLGIRAFEGANDQRRNYSYEQRKGSRLYKDDERRFRANLKAGDFFQAQPPWYRRTASFWVVSATGRNPAKKAGHPK